MRIARLARHAAGLFLAAGFALAAPRPAEAGFTFVIDWATTRVTGSGAIDLSNLNLIDHLSGYSDALIGPLGPDLWQVNGSADVYDGLFGPSSFGDSGGGSAIIFSGFFGDNVGLYGAVPGSLVEYRLIVPSGYVSGTQLTATMEFNRGSTGIGVTPGTYVWNQQDASGNLIPTLTIIAQGPPGPRPVPEPATLLLLGAGLVGLGAARRRTG